MDDLLVVTQKIKTEGYFMQPIKTDLDGIWEVYMHDSSFFVFLSENDRF